MWHAFSAGSSTRGLDYGTPPSDVWLGEPLLLRRAHFAFTADLSDARQPWLFDVKMAIVVGVAGRGEARPGVCDGSLDSCGAQSLDHELLARGDLGLRVMRRWALRGAKSARLARSGRGMVAGWGGAVGRMGEVGGRGAPGLGRVIGVSWVLHRVLSWPGRGGSRSEAWALRTRPGGCDGPRSNSSTETVIH